jgi:predicted sulfurtransferase
MIRNTVSILVISLLIISLFSRIAIAQTTINRMGKEELKTRLSDPQTVVVDVRSGRGWSSSELKIKGAMRIELRDAASAVETYDKDKTLVFYCT